MRLGHIRDELKALVRTFEAGRLTGDAALEAVRTAKEIENLARLVKARSATRVAECDRWRAAGAASAKEFLAGQTGESAGQVGRLVDTAGKVDDLGATREAVESGEVSLDQAAVIADAVDDNPQAEQSLVDTATSKDLGSLRKEAAEAKAQADRDEESRHARPRRQRHLRAWVDAEGMGNVSWRTTVDEYQAFLAVHQQFRDRALKDAYRAGRRDPDAHLASDGMARLVHAAASGGDGSVAKRDVRVLIQVTDTALLRGRTEPGETCEVAGVGPVSVDEAKRLAGPNPFVSLVETNGVDVARVVRVGRKRPPEVDDALLVRDRGCVVPGFARTARLEVHHTVPYAKAGRTTLAELATVCCHHHDLITHRGYQLHGGPGTWTWHPPNAPPQGDPGARSRTGREQLELSAS